MASEQSEVIRLHRHESEGKYKLTVRHTKNGGHTWHRYEFDSEREREHQEGFWLEHANRFGIEWSRLNHRPTQSGSDN